MKIAVIGGSIAGCICYQLLVRAGHDVVVFEAQERGLADDGAGFALAADVIETMVAEGLVSAGFITRPTEGLAYLVKEPGGSRGGFKECFFADAPHVHGFWGDLWSEVRRGVPDDHYILGARAINITQSCDGPVKVDFCGMDSISADLVVCADGARSLGRKLLFPEIRPRYAGYFGWRGIIAASHLDTLDPFLGRVNLVWRQGGAQSAFYVIERGNEAFVNWVSFVRRDSAAMREMLQDGTDSKALTGFLSAKAEARMKSIVPRTMPDYFANIIDKTTGTFAHAIHEIHVPTYNKGRVLLLGDAGTLCRPHAEMGIAKALFDALTLARLLGGSVSQDDIDGWGQRRSAVAEGHYRVGQQLGDAFVFNVPDMESMTREDIQSWLMYSLAL